MGDPRSPVRESGIVTGVIDRFEAGPVSAVPDNPRTLGALLDAVARSLHDMPIGNSREEARDLVAATLEVPRLALVRRESEDTDPAVVTAVWAAVQRRRVGMPLAYAVGRAAFRHLTLVVDPRVLIPRPETELLVDIVLTETCPSDARRGAGRSGVVVDVGTGSGAIALALATEGHYAKVIGTDVSSDALAVARGNAARLGGADTARVDFRPGSYLAPVHERGVQAVVSNPPYISFAEGEVLPASVREWEPTVALLAGGEGMAPTAAIVREAAVVLAPGGLLALEADERRATLAAELVFADGRYDNVSVRRDLTGRERFVVARRGTRS